jgi:hypothetical protein
MGAKLRHIGVAGGGYNWVEVKGNWVRWEVMGGLVWSFPFWLKSGNLLRKFRGI